MSAFEEWFIRVVLGFMAVIIVGIFSAFTYYHPVEMLIGLGSTILLGLLLAGIAYVLSKRFPPRGY